jgi:hypothetical protein
MGQHSWNECGGRGRDEAVLLDHVPENRAEMLADHRVGLTDSIETPRRLSVASEAEDTLRCADLSPNYTSGRRCDVCRPTRLMLKFVLIGI